MPPKRTNQRSYRAERERVEARKQLKKQADRRYYLNWSEEQKEKKRERDRLRYQKIKQSEKEALAAREREIEAQAEQNKLEKRRAAGRERIARWRKNVSIKLRLKAVGISHAHFLTAATQQWSHG